MSQSRILKKLGDAVYALGLLTGLAVTPLAMAQTSDDEPRLVDFGDFSWRVTAKDAVITEHKGRQALALTRGRIWADDAAFKDGVISFDAAYDEHQVFIGAGWRASDQDRSEEMYFRGHLNNKPDAMQYTPVENGLSAWQIFSDGNATASVDQTYTDWNKVKIVIIGDKADIYFNSEEPVLHVPDLKADLGTGGVILRATGRNSKTVHFSNLVIRPLTEDDTIVGTPKPSAELPEGVITDWQVSSPFTEDKVRDELLLKAEHTDGLTWQSLATETNGIANLAKLSKRTRQIETAFVRLKITSSTDQMKAMQFGYSDRARIYLNGKRVYFGNAGWRVRDYRFLGTVGFFDEVGLDLKAGDNEVLIAVSETFGGWAWGAAIKDRSGIVVSGD